MALNASILRLEAHQIVSLFTATLAALIVPGVFLLGRGVFRFSAAGAGVLALAIGTSPVLAYAVHHTAAAQLMATMAAALLAWVGIRAFDTTRRGLAFRRWLLLAVTAVWLVAGTYNFLLPALLAPPALWVAMRSWRTRRLRHGLAWAGFVCAAAAVVALLFPARFIAIGQRMLLFEEYDFGWRIPALRPDGWIGAVGNARLEPASGPMVAAAVVVLLVSLWSFLPGRGTRSRALSALVCFAGVPLAGYGIFLLEAHAKGNNASYDAYKLLSVFLPMIVGGMCPWLGFGPREPMLRRGVAAAAACLLVGLNLAGARHFQRAMAHPPLAVEADLLDLGRIEEMPQVDGINLRVDQFWSRLWANALLLKKRQYFPSHTYEGRRPTELLGNFDLVDAMARPGGIAGTGVVLENDSFALIDRRESARLEIGFGPGWYGLERYGSESWRWSASSPVIEVDNRTDASLRANLVLDLLPAEPRDLRVVWRGRELIRRELALERTTVHAGPVDIPPGRSELRLESSLAPTPAPAGDPRLLLVRLFAIRIDVARGD